MFDHPGQVFTNEVLGCRALEEMGGLFLQYQVCQSVQCSQAAQHFRSILKTGWIRVGVPAISKNGMSKAHARTFAGRRETRIAAVNQIIPEHKAEVTRMIDREFHKGKIHCTYIGYNILRKSSAIDVSARSLIGQDCDFRKQAFGTAEMVCGSCWRNTGFLGGCAQ